MSPIRGIEELLTSHPFFVDLDAATVTQLAGCARNEHIATNDLLFRTGEPADRFYVVRRGRVALELLAPGSARTVMDTVEAGHVLGWSWLVPPYRWFCDARAVEPSDVVTFDASCLRTKCEADPALGYALLQQVTAVMYERLQGARVRLLDLYGAPDAHHW